MKIILKDVGYNRGYVIGPYLQERPGVNADVILEEGDDQEECALKALHYLKSITDKFHIQANPHLAGQPITYAPEQMPVISQDKERADTVAQLIADIYTCKELKVLEEYRLLAKSKPEIQAAYDMQWTKLNQPKNQTND